jgi:hypothetical protein
MDPMLWTAMVCLYIGWLFMLLGVGSLFRLSMVAPVAMSIGYALSSFVAFWVMPSESADVVQGKYWTFVVDAITWSHTYRLPIGLVAIGIVGAFIIMALDARVGVRPWLGGSRLSIGLLLLVSWILNAVNSKDPLVELARTGQRYEKRFPDQKLYAQEKPFHLRVPKEFLTDEETQKELAGLAESTYDHLKGSSTDTLKVTKVVGFRMMSADNKVIDEVIVEFEGVITKKVPKKVTKKVDRGGKMVDEEVEEVMDVPTPTKAGITIPFEPNEEKTAKMAKQVKGYLENKLREVEPKRAGTRSGRSSDGDDGVPKAAKFPRLVPLLDPIK